MSTPPAPAADDAAKAIAGLAERHGSQLYGLGLRLCRSPQDAEDLVQETFLQAFRAWDRFRNDAKPLTWLYTIASHVCSRHRRRRAGEPAHKLSLDTVLPSASDGVLDLPAGGDGPLQKLLGREQREAVDRAIAELPETFKLPLVLKEIAELPIAEVAQILNLKPATVKTRVHRARLLLAKQLTRTLATRPAPPADHPRAVCLALLRGKQEALDQGVPFRADGELCVRCQSLFRSLDLAHTACAQLHAGEMPATLLAAIERDLTVVRKRGKER